jgi:hypothetical protein
MIVRMSRLIYFICLYSVFGQVLALPPKHFVSDSQNAPTVTLPNGSYFGIHSSHYQQDFFLGIPFAQPPVGDLRLRLPASLNTSWTGAKNATEYSPACFGYGEDTQIGAGNYCSEDCLTLNIVRPSGYENEELPIGVWIYGSVHDLIFRVMFNLLIMNLEADFMRAQIAIRGIICHSLLNNQWRLVSQSLELALIIAFMAGDFCTLRMSWMLESPILASETNGMSL